MGKATPDFPELPDPYNLANLQFKNQLRGARATEILNAPNVQGPFGNISTNVTGYREIQIEGPGGQMETVRIPVRETTRTLRPELQQVQAGRLAGKQAASGMIGDVIGNAPTTPIDFGQPLEAPGLEDVQGTRQRLLGSFNQSMNRFAPSNYIPDELLVSDYRPRPVQQPSQSPGKPMGGAMPPQPTPIEPQAQQIDGLANEVREEFQPSLDASELAEVAGGIGQFRQIGQPQGLGDLSDAEIIQLVNAMGPAAGNIYGVLSRALMGAALLSNNEQTPAGTPQGQKKGGAPAQPQPPGSGLGDGGLG